MKRAAALAFVTVLAACAPDGDDVDSFTTAIPRAILAECAAPPADLEARLWISGSKVPCALDVDVAAGTTTGNCVAAPGRVRTLTLDWFVPNGGIDLVVAQAQGELDLSDTAAADASFTVGDDAVQLKGCRDMTVDQVTGAPTINVGGSDVPVCDVDESCADNASDECTNLGEICAGTDPFDAGDEP